MSVHDDTLQGLQEALDYIRGDDSKGRSVFIPKQRYDDEETQLLFQKIMNLSEPNKQMAIRYIDELAEVSS
jgi:hypothetical protein